MGSADGVRRKIRDQVNTFDTIVGRGGGVESLLSRSYNVLIFSLLVPC